MHSEAMLGSSSCVEAFFRRCIEQQKRAQRPYFAICGATSGARHAKWDEKKLKAALPGKEPANCRPSFVPGWAAGAAALTYIYNILIMF
jgi:hypothetical protein